MKKVLFLLVATVALQACTTPPHELKSPCVSLQGGAACGSNFEDAAKWMKSEA